MATIKQQAAALIVLSTIAITAAIGCADLTIPQPPEAPVHISVREHNRVLVVGHDMRAGRWQSICASRVFNSIEPSVIIAPHPQPRRPEILPYKKSQNFAVQDGDVLSVTGCDLYGPLPDDAPIADTR